MPKINLMMPNAFEERPGIGLEATPVKLSSLLGNAFFSINEHITYGAITFVYGDVSYLCEFIPSVRRRFQRNLPAFTRGINLFFPARLNKASTPAALIPSRLSADNFLK